MIKTTVISVRGQDYESLMANPDFVYVGRRVHYTKWQTPSVFANPYSVHSFPSNALAFFEADLALAYLGLIVPKRMDRHGKSHHYEDQFRAMIPRLGELRGKTLGCWCGNYPENPDLVCHARLLAELVNAIEGSKR